MKKTFPNASEIQNFHWHCDVAALLLKTFPLEPAVRSNLAHAIRLATFCCTGKNGIRYATRRAYDKQRETGGDWYKLGLIREHVFPVGQVVSRVVQDIVSPPSTRSGLLEHLVAEDLQRWPLVEGQPVTDGAAIAALVRKHSLIAWATEEDDEALRKAGLAKKMPPMPGGFDPFARYRHCGIEWIDLHRAAATA
jgi:hypothetical protein